MSDYAIEIKNLKKAYGRNIAVDGLNLSIKQGELFSLLGVNGAGKTTTMKMLSGLVLPSGGDATLCGYSILHDANEVKKRIGVSPQETSVAQNLTVLENLKFMCGVYGFGSDKTHKKIDEITEKLQLNTVINKRAAKLSGGWQRRLSIAMALVGDPEILFLDEPTLGLDVLARSELWDVIRSLKGKVTVLLTTHYMEEAEALSDRIGIMKEGKLLALGTSNELKKLANKEKFEEAFIAIVKGDFRCE